MKKIKLVVLIAMFFGTAMLNADTYGKQNSFGINPFGLILNIYSGEYGRFMDAEGTTEINIPFYYFGYEDFTALGLGAKYRIYKDANGEGVFYGGGITIDSWSWEFDYYDTSTMQTEEADASWLTITPLAELGYRWSWPNGWTIAPSIELGFNVSTFEADSDDWGTLDYGDQGLHWGLNLGVAYMF